MMTSPSSAAAMAARHAGSARSISYCALLRCIKAKGIRQAGHRAGRHANVSRHHSNMARQLSVSRLAEKVAVRDLWGRLGHAVAPDRAHE